MDVRIERTDDPTVVLDRAGAHLASRPVEHNLILTLLHQRIAAPEPGRYWVVEERDVVVGVAFQSPIGYVVTATPMGRGAVDALVAAVVTDGGVVPGIQAEAATAARIAGQWTELNGTAAVPRMGMRIYAMDSVDPPARVDGELRTATTDDLHPVLGWIEGFHRDTGEPSVLQPGVHEQRVASGAYRLWCVDGKPVSMCARTPALEGAARVNAVYTPPELRGRGYAAAGVAALSAEILDEGATPMLFTDLGNPTSNKVYRRIGYRAVAENLRYDFS